MHRASMAVEVLEKWNAALAAGFWRGVAPGECCQNKLRCEDKNVFTPATHFFRTVNLAPWRVYIAEAIILRKTMLLSGLLPGTGLSHIRRELDERPGYIICVFWISFLQNQRLASQIGSGEATLTQASSLGQIYGSNAFGPLAKFPVATGSANVCWKTLVDPFLRPNTSRDSRAYASIVRHDLAVKAWVQNMFLNRVICLRLQDVITYVELPMNSDDGVRLTTWPIALPHHMAYQLLKAGFRELLGEANDFYWQTMSDEFGVQKPQFQDSIGIQLYGDECQFFENEQWMCFHWMSDNSIWWKDGRKSRFLICMIPVSKYAVHNGVNLTLQSVLSAVVVSLNFWRSNSHPNCEAFCFLCEGSKGMERPITDLSVSAGWRCDVARPPWNSEPSLMQVEGFSLALVGLDLLHIWYLGCGRDLVGSVLVILIRTGFFPGNTVLSSVKHPNLYCHMYSFCAHVGFVVSI